MAPPLFPKPETFEYVEKNDPVFEEHLYEYWALLDACP